MRAYDWAGNLNEEDFTVIVSNDDSDFRVLLGHVVLTMGAIARPPSAYLTYLRIKEQHKGQIPKKAAIYYFLYLVAIVVALYVIEQVIIALPNKVGREMAKNEHSSPSYWSTRYLRSAFFVACYS